MSMLSLAIKQMSKRGRGQPSKYIPEYNEQLVTHMGKGLSFESFGGVIGVAKQTLYNWKESHPEFADAQGVGTELSRLFWEQLGIDHVVSVSESDRDAKTSSSKSLNGMVWSLNMRNRFQWREKQPEEVDRTIVNVGNLTDEQLKDMARELLKDEETK